MTVLLGAGLARSGPVLAKAPAPPWWSGNCDVNNNPGSHPLGASYDGVEACGPGSAQGGNDRLVRFFPGAWGEYEWECVELAMRYMYLVYGIPPYGANGDTVVSNYPGSALAKVSNDGASLPAPGDIVSEAGTNGNPNGHTAVVTAVDVVSGSGTVTIMEENASATGWNTISVSGNVLGSRVTGWLHAPGAAQAHRARYDVNGDGRSDTCMVSGVNGGTTGSGQAELHCLYGADFSSRVDIATPWSSVTTRTGRLFLADVNGDGHADACMVSGVNGGVTDSGHAEVHCLYGGDFQTRLDVATPWRSLRTRTDPLFLADVNGDGRADLCRVTGVNGGTTASGHAGVHCLYGGRFRTRLDVATPWGYLRTRKDPLFLADVNGDGRADLCQVAGVNHGTTASGHLEVHCLDAASRFQSRLDVVTPWGYLRTRKDPLFLADVNGDGRADLCQLTGVNHGTTASGHAEVHCLYGGDFSARLDVATPWGYLSTKTPLFTADVNGDGLADVCQVTGVNGGTTGSGLAEVHCLYGGDFSAPLNVATPWPYLSTHTNAILDHL